MIQGTGPKEGARNDLQEPRGSLADHEKKEIIDVLGKAQFVGGLLWEGIGKYPSPTHKEAMT